MKIKNGDYIKFLRDGDIIKVVDVEKRLGEIIDDPYYFWDHHGCKIGDTVRLSFATMEMNSDVVKKLSGYETPLWKVINEKK